MPLLETEIGPVDYVERGEGDQLLLLFHASATVPIALMGLMKRLEGTGRRLFAPASYKAGATDVKQPDGVSFTDANLAIAEAVWDRLDANQPILFGHSKGGVTALKLALERASNGQPPAALILFEPVLYSMLDRAIPEEAAQWDWDQAVIAKLKSEIANGNDEAGVKAFVEAWNDAKWEDLPEPARAFLVSDAKNLAAEAAEVVDIQIDFAKLESFEVPTLVISGENGPTFTKLACQNLVKHLPNGRHVTLAGVGHMGPINRPGLIAEAISAFIAEI